VLKKTHRKLSLRLKIQLMAILLLSKQMTALLTMLNEYGLTASETEFELPNVGSDVLKTVITLLKQVQAFQKIDVGEFTNDQLRELVLVVYHLGFSELQASLCQVIADRLENQSTAYMQTYFGIQKEHTK